MQEARAIAAGKRLAWSLLPIENGDQGNPSVEDVAAKVQHKSETGKEETEDTVPKVDRGTAKKRYSSKTVFIGQSRQSSNDPTFSVADK